MKKLIILVMSTLTAGILFVVSLQFLLKPKEDETLFTLAGKTVTADDFGDTDTESRKMIYGIQNTQAPKVRYDETTYSTGSVVYMKRLLSVMMPGETSYVSGETEKGFSIVVTDVMDQDGKSVAPVSDELEDGAEIVGKVSYNQTEQTVVFHEKGVYRIRLKVYGNNGRYVVTEIKVPVED